MLDSILSVPGFTNTQILEQFQDFSFKSFIKFSKRFLKSGVSWWVFNGNLNSEDAIKIWLSAVEKLYFISLFGKNK